MALLSQLLALLQEERNALLEGKVDGARLAQLAEEKRGQLNALEGFEQQRRHALRRLGYSDDRTGDERAAADADCLSLWRSICERAGEVADLNRGNGALINIRLEHNRRLLDFLRAAASKELYGPDGRTRVHTARLNSRA